MLSYQHEYHVGNHADVLKHAVLAIVVRALQRKPTPLRVIDCHAGAGVYDLTSPLTQRGREFESGVGRLFGARDAPASLAPYLDALARLNPNGRLIRYPGSAQLALSLLRPADQLELFELHPQALAALRRSFAGCRQVHIHKRDALEGLVAVVPPKERRGVALLDSAYEDKDDYRRVPVALAAAARRWGHGVYLVWYPLIRQSGTARLLGDLADLGLPRSYRVELMLAPSAAGLRGSGLVIVNLPHGVDAELAALLPWLNGKLADGTASTWHAGWL